MLDTSGEKYEKVRGINLKSALSAEPSQEDEPALVY
jgi:hypothetical protein